MAPLTVGPDQDTRTEAANGDYDRWEPAAYYAPDFDFRVKRELDRLAALESNWDGEGAPPIDPAIIEAARTLIAKLPRDVSSIPAVVPSAAGNLQFEWNAGRRSLELEIETPATIHYLKWDPDQGIEEEDTFDINDMGKTLFLIRWFMRGVAHV
jgi:hypothetical protein